MNIERFINDKEILKNMNYRFRTNIYDPNNPLYQITKTNEDIEREKIINLADKIIKNYKSTNETEPKNQLSINPPNITQEKINDSEITIHNNEPIHVIADRIVEETYKKWGIKPLPIEELIPSLGKEELTFKEYFSNKLSETYQKVKKIFR